jgi:hypothetical protein
MCSSSSARSISRLNDRHAEKLREELTLVPIDRHSGQFEELNVGGLWVQASIFTSSNPLISWLRQIEALRSVA